jgi:hypothetical protein
MARYAHAVALVKTALGFRAHTGWTVVVAVGGDTSSAVFIERRRLELSDSSVPAQPYHAARALPIEKAVALIGRAQEVARDAALLSLGGFLEELRAQEHKLVGAGLPTSSTRIPSSLRTILGSHPLVHAAEGELFREALVHAADAYGLPLVRVPARDLAEQARNATQLDERSLREFLAELGRSAGPPWRQDERDAAMAACIAFSRR